MSSTLPSPAVPASSTPPQGDERATLQRLLDRGFPWMRFPAELEARFQQDMVAQRLQHFLLSGIVALLVYNGFLVVDYLMASDVFWLALQIRLFVFTPLAAAVLWAYWRWGPRILAWRLPVLVEGPVLCSGLMAAASLAFILSSSHTALSHYYHVGFIVVIIYGNIVQRLRFWMAVPFSLLVLAMHLGGIVVLDHMPPRLLGPIVIMVVATIVFTLMANYALERDERRHYLLTLREKALVQELAHTHARLMELSKVDSLTELANRGHFQDYLQQVWRRAAPDRTSLALLMVDVDHFKKYNDRYGHPAGDAALREVARVLGSNLRRPGDLVARYGGEEFVAVLPQSSPETASQVAERVRQAVEGLQVRHEGSSTARVLTVSVGVAHGVAGNLASPEALLKQADQALYQAKREGRNRIRLLMQP
ncbi:GGDEF domain-containing protein [Aquabacterium olei]|uniref:GGDEF domain-containing protein n=1 Tax=Aquabacterium olei TaxID=1296669 RepID=UPI00131F06CC|nr:diguanylate cyclase [Aquabacterium olei]